MEACAFGAVVAEVFPLALVGAVGENLARGAPTLRLGLSQAIGTPKISFGFIHSPDVSMVDKHLGAGLQDASGDEAPPFALCLDFLPRRRWSCGRDGHVEHTPYLSPTFVFRDA